MRDIHRKLTTADLKTMTAADINQYWLDRQAYGRAHGTPYYTRLIVPETGEVIATLPSQESASSLLASERAWARKGGE